MSIPKQRVYLSDGMKKVRASDSFNGEHKLFDKWVIFHNSSHHGDVCRVPSTWWGPSIPADLVIDFSSWPELSALPRWGAAGGVAARSAAGEVHEQSWLYDRAVSPSPALSQACQLGIVSHLRFCFSWEDSFTDLINSLLHLCPGKVI